MRITRRCNRTPKSVAPDSIHDFPPVYCLPHTVPHLCYDGVAHEHGAQAPGKEDTGSRSGSHGAIIQSFAFFLHCYRSAIGRTPPARQALVGAGEPPLRYNGAPTTSEMRVSSRCARVCSTHARQGETAMPFYTKGDVRIRYEETGSGFPLLVTPGGGLNSRVSNWPTAVINAMEEFKHDFRCITMDQRNANG